MSKHETPTAAPTSLIAIDALSVAAEFLLCAIRDAVAGDTTRSAAVRQSITWANAKIDEAVRALGDR